MTVDDNANDAAEKVKRSRKEMANRHISAFRRRLNYLTKKRDEQGDANSYIAAEIAALEWVLFDWDTDN